MSSRGAATAALMLLTSVAAVGSWGGSALAQTTQQAREIPQSFRLAHDETLAQLTAIGKRRTRTGAIARKAIEAVNKWKFRPGYKGGQPVAVQATIEVNFRLL